MGKFVKGDTVVIPFPFSDLTGSKHRPAFSVFTMCNQTAKLIENAVSETAAEIQAHRK